MHDRIGPMAKVEVTNVQVGGDLGVSHATISRIRSGDRLPSLDLMLRIETKYRWRLSDQAKARTEGNYAATFEHSIGVFYDLVGADEFHPPVAANFGVG